MEQEIEKLFSCYLTMYRCRKQGRRRGVNMYEFKDETRNKMPTRVTAFKDVLLVFLEDLQQESKNGDLQEMIANMDLARQLLEAVTEVKTALEKVNDRFRQNMIPEAMEASNTELIRVAGVGRVNLVSDIYCSTESGKGEELKEWLTVNGFEDLIKPTVNASTLKAWAKARMKEMKELPPMVKITPFTRAQLTRG